MSRSIAFKLFVTAVLICIASTHSDADEDVIRRGLSYVQSTGQRWIERRGCVSCHQIPSMIWASTAASSSGLAVDNDAIGQWIGWSTDVVNFVKPDTELKPG